MCALSVLNLAEKNASNTVLQKAGLKFAAKVDDPDEGKLWRLLLFSH
jgi:hypothetical protein